MNNLGYTILGFAIGLYWFDIRDFIFRKNKQKRNIKYIKTTPEEINLEFKTKSGKKVNFKAIRPKADVKIVQKTRN